MHLHITIPTTYTQDITYRETGSPVRIRKYSFWSSNLLVLAGKYYWDVKRWRNVKVEPISPDFVRNTDSSPSQLPLLTSSGLLRLDSLQSYCFLSWFLSSRVASWTSCWCLQWNQLDRNYLFIILILILIYLLRWRVACVFIP